jgi:hypothetical protein
MSFTKSLSLPMWHSRPSLMSQITNNYISNSALCRSHCSCGLLHRSAAAHLLRLWVQIPLGAWMFVCCEFFLFSGRDFCDELYTHPEESYRLVHHWVRSRNLMNEEALAHRGLSHQKQQQCSLIRHSCSHKP